MATAPALTRAEFPSAGAVTFRPVLEVLLRDEEYREALAQAAYVKERQEDAALDREQNLEPADYFIIAWEDLSDHSKRPYRTAVAVACEQIASLPSAA